MTRDLISSWPIGKKVKLTFVFRRADTSGLVDSAEVIAKVRKSDGSLMTFLLSADEVTRVSLGTYTVTVTVDMAGYWEYEAEAVDPTFEASTEPRRMYVRISN